MHSYVLLCVIYPMAKKKDGDKGFDPKDWARDQRSVNSRTCMACMDPYKGVIINVLDEMSAGRAPGVSMEALCTMLADKFGFTNGVSALRQHIRRHETDRWSKIRQAL